MKMLSIILVLSTATIYSWAQTKSDREKEDYIQFIFESNLPEDLFNFYNQEKIKTKYKINKDLNPFYLRGDFDGDGKIDYALAVLDISIKDGIQNKVLIYHPVKKTYFIIPYYVLIGAWTVYEKEREVELGIGEKERIKLQGDAILAIKLESSSGLIYWDKKEYKWYHQGD